MKFGIFFEISIPRPWEDGVEKRVYDNCLEQAIVADESGFDYCWAVEHHFLEEYSHCSAPEVFLTAVAMKTQRIRIGQGIAVCVPEFNHPIRLAERAAVMDILSGGRLDFGTGRSATWTELGGFRASPDTTKATWDEFVSAIPKMWTQERYSHDGVAFSMPSRAVLPKPSPEAAPADVGRRHQPGHRARRRAPRHGRARPHLRRLRGAGEEDQDLPPDHPQLRAGRRHGQRPGGDGELPVLPPGRRDRRRDRQSPRRLVPLPRGAAGLGARELPRQGLRQLRAAASAPASAAGRARRGGRAAAQPLHRRSRSASPACSSSGRRRASTASTSSSTPTRRWSRPRCSTACGCSAAR